MLHWTWPKKPQDLLWRHLSQLYMIKTLSSAAMSFADPDLLSHCSADQIYLDFSETKRIFGKEFHTFLHHYSVSSMPKLFADLDLLFKLCLTSVHFVQLQFSDYKTFLEETSHKLYTYLDMSSNTCLVC